MGSPKVSLCFPTYNRARYLKKALAMALSQTFQDFEILVCDDASTDDTEQVVRSFSDSRLTYVRNPENLGIPGNLIRGMELARGAYILMLHDHDEYEPTLVEEMAALLDEDPSVGFVHSGVAWVDEEGNTEQTFVGPWDRIIPGRRMAERMLSSFNSPISAESMVRRSAYDEAGGYDRRFGFLSDIDLWFRLALRFKVGYVARPLLRCRRREPDHRYAGISWEYTRWISAIHEANIPHIYEREPWRRRWRLFQWSLRRDRLYLQTLLHALYQNRSDLAIEGLDLMRRECRLPLRLLAAWLKRSQTARAWSTRLLQDLFSSRAA